MTDKPTDWITGFSWDSDESPTDVSVAILGLRRYSGTTFVCEVPHELGPVIRLEQRGGKVIAHTESGMQMIVPTGVP